MRSVLALLAAIVLLASTAGSAAALRAFKETEHLQDIGCDGVQTPDGTAYFYAVISDLRGIDGYLDVVTGDVDDPDVVWTRDQERAVEMTFDGSTTSVTIPLLPAGEAHIEATLEPADPVSFTDNGKEGNSRFRSTATGTFFAVAGTLTLPGSGPVALDPMQCGASDAVIENFFTRPHAAVSTFSSDGGACTIVNDDEDTATVFFGLDEDDGFLIIDAFVEDAGSDAIGAIGSAELPTGPATISLDEYDPETGAPNGKVATADITVDSTATGVDYVIRASNLRGRATGSVLGVDGTLSTSLGTFDLGSCSIGTIRFKAIVTPSNGPKPSEKAPANDLPAGAIALQPGSKTQSSTRGAQVPSEAGYPCMVLEDFDGSIITIPVERTVWYRIEGTGRPVTIDTAGSDYDTVLAVYAGEPDARATVACVDDVDLDPVGVTIQAAATVPTTAGTTYWVQIGGFEEAIFGPDPNVPYGNLRVAVR